MFGARDGEEEMEIDWVTETGKEVENEREADE